MSAVKPLQDERHLSDAQPFEPAMEDILASIRRIIADDQLVFADAGPDIGPGEGVEPPDGQDAPMADPAPAPGIRPARSTGSGAAASARGPSPALVSPSAEASVASAFNALVASRFAKNADAIATLTTDALAPLIKAWLDENLPPLVERLVAAEIQRITREG
jgi:cell pole-organizing protein PopZ